MGDTEAPRSPSVDGLADWLAQPPPRSNDAVRAIVHAQRSGWRMTYTYCVVTAVVSVIATVRDPAWWASGLGIALGASWLLCAAIVLAGRRSAHRLARDGRVSVARFEPGRAPSHAVRFIDHEDHERCATWIPDRASEPPRPTASVLYLPNGRAAFVWAEGRKGRAFQNAILLRDAPTEDAAGIAPADAIAALGPPALAIALRAPTPRAGSALRTMIGAQRSEWLWMAVLALAFLIGCGLDAAIDRAGFLGSTMFWIAAFGGLVMTGFAILGIGIAVGLARHGECAPAKLEDLGGGYYAVHFGDDLTIGARRAVWNAGRLLTAGATAHVLFHPRGRWAFVWALGTEFKGVAKQDARAAQPRAQLRS